jgi:hypothetical protein
MRHKLRTVPAALLSAAATLVLSACGGSGDDAPPDAGTLAPATATEVETTAPTDAQPTAEPTNDDAEWFSITDQPSGITFMMPEQIDAESNTATVADGTSVALRNYSAMTMDDIEVGFNVIDTPGEGYDFDAGIEGVATTLDGEVVSRTETDVAGSPAVDVEMTYGDGYIVFFRLVTGDEHIVQSLASGPQTERAAVEVTYQQLSESVEVG